jgi:uncharacterized protein YbjT (DUF2867 family)
MKIILFGATGMVGQGVLRECLLDPEVSAVLAIGRNPTGRQHDRQHEKLSEIVQPNLLEYSAVASRLSGFDACFFCLGVTSAGMSEEQYTRVTYDITLAAAKTLVSLNPAMTFTYISGQRTDSSERGRSMWARVKGRTENALLRLPFKAVYLFRPGLIVPMHGAVSRTRLYRVIYKLLGPVTGWVVRLNPKFGTTTEQIGRAMLHLAKQRAPSGIFDNASINAL